MENCFADNFDFRDDKGYIAVQVVYDQEVKLSGLCVNAVIFAPTVHTDKAIVGLGGSYLQSNELLILFCAKIIRGAVSIRDKHLPTSACQSLHHGEFADLPYG